MLIRCFINGDWCGNFTNWDNVLEFISLHATALYYGGRDRRVEINRHYANGAITVWLIDRA